MMNRRLIRPYWFTVCMTITCLSAALLFIGLSVFKDISDLGETKITCLDFSRKTYRLLSACQHIIVDKSRMP